MPMTKRMCRRTVWDIYVEDSESHKTGYWGSAHSEDDAIQVCCFLKRNDYANAWYNRRVVHYANHEEPWSHRGEHKKETD